MKNNIKPTVLSMILLVAFAFISCDSASVSDLYGGGTYTVTYDRNGATVGTVPIDNTKYVKTGAVRVLGRGDLAKTGCGFVGWNTMADGTGVSYHYGDTLKITDNIILYAQWVNGVLPSEFSVSNTKKVYFSKGNLYYTGGTDGTWKFETEQYATTPAANGGWDSTHVSHFYWSKNASVAYNESYSDTNAAIDDVLFTNETAETPKYDFIVNGVAGKYMSLSVAEWIYLFNVRTDSANKYGYATVCGQNGVIILPDEFTDPMKNNGSNAFKPGKTDATSDWSDNIYTIGESWDAMEEAGAVFLPAAGARNGSSVSSFGVLGLYRSSTPNGTSEYGFGYTNSSIFPAGIYQRNLGFCIRLAVSVHD